MAFDIKIKMNDTNKIIKDHGLDRDGRAVKFLRDTVDRFCDAYIPMQSGKLKNTKLYRDNHSITYVSPYAHYMYKGKVYISPSLGVSGVKTKSGRWWSPKGETKTPTNRSFNYNGAPKRGAEWDKRMKADRKKDIERDLQNFLKGK